MSSEQASTVPTEAESLNSTGSPPSTESPQPAEAGGSRGEVAAVQPVIGISQRVQTGPRRKKDLGMLGMLQLLQI